MEKFIGMICPFCKTEIKDGDAVKVCPSCSIPHHEVCWEKNNGCTTIGCPERHYEAHYVNPSDMCVNCGALLDDDQEFCPKCGTPKGGKKKRICAKCGAELEDGHEFCPKCGQKASYINDSNDNSTISQLKETVSKTYEKANKKGKIIGVIGLIAVIVAVFIFIAPKIFVSIDTLCAQGNYEKAYARASEDEKNTVLAENIIAYLSYESSENLKDPSSFLLRDAYYIVSYNAGEERIYQQAVLYISGKNGFGGNSSSYWIWGADENGDWSYIGSCSGLNLDSDDDDYIVSLIATVLVESRNAIKLSNASIKNINKAFESGELDSIVLIGNDALDTSIMPKDGEN